MEQQSKIRVERKFVLLLIHTPFGLSFFNKIAKTRAARIYSEFSTYLMPLITALAIALFFIAIIGIFSNTAAREGARSLGPQANLLIPGLNPIIPWTYGWIALVITIVIHEAGHGIVARVYDIKIESTGIVLFLVFPIGAFVNIEREELAKSSLKQKSAILTAGPLNNMIIAAVSLAALYFLISTLNPLPDPDQNLAVEVRGVKSGSLAEKLGLTQGSAIEKIDGQEVVQLNDVRKLLQSSIGDNVEVTWKDRNGDVITHSGQNRNGLLGVELTQNVSPSIVLELYLAAFLDPLGKDTINNQVPNYQIILVPPTLMESYVPYSDTMAVKYESNLLGPYFPLIANMLFWIMFINFNVGIFNALPIGPFDGGQLYSSLIENKIKREGKVVNPATLSAAITYIFIAIVIILIAVPWILE